jgi:nickel-dependent lactate racemase
MSSVRLVCAVGLHRKFIASELGGIIGKDLVTKCGPAMLFNHDAEDADQMVYLGETGRHQEVEVNRLVIDSDRLIYICEVEE